MLVALTREFGRNGELRQWVGSRADVVEVPLTVTHYRPRRDVDAEIHASVYAGNFRSLVVTSARAQNYLDLAINALEAEHDVFSVGRVTTRSLERVGLHVVSESSGAAVELVASITRGPVLLLGAVGGRDELLTVLMRRDVDGVHVGCYETRRAELSDAAREQLRRADVVFIGAPSAWRAARELVAPNAWVLVPGDTTLAEVRVGHARVVRGWGDEFTSAWARITSATSGHSTR